MVARSRMPIWPCLARLTVYCYMVLPFIFHFFRGGGGGMLLFPPCLLDSALSTVAYPLAASLL
jgi:hypothetical protein